MPRYDFECFKCKRETVIYSHHDVDTSRIKCEHCGHHDPALVQFFRTDQAELLALEYKIGDLENRIEKLEQLLGDDELPETEYN